MCVEERRMRDADAQFRVVLVRGPGEADAHAKGRREHDAAAEVELGAKRPDGSAVLRMDVCIDWPLRGWILSFGAAARVVSPAALAVEIGEQHKRAAEKYRVAPKLEMARMQIIGPKRTLPNAG